MKGKVLGTRLLTTELKEEKTASGIVIADTVDNTTRYKVHFVGIERQEIELDDVIYVPEQIGKNSPKLTIKGTEYTVIDENKVAYYERNTD